MKKFDLSLSDLNAIFPDNFSEEQMAKAKTMFLKELALSATSSTAARS